MRLYESAGLVTARKDDAKARSRETGEPWIELEVPTTRDELIRLLTWWGPIHNPQLGDRFVLAINPPSGKRIGAPDLRGELDEKAAANGGPEGLASEPTERIADPDRPAFLGPQLSVEHAEARRMAIGRCPRCNGTPRGAHLLLKGEEKDAILAWIEEADELWQIEAIALAVRDRVRALGLAIEEGGSVQ